VCDRLVLLSAGKVVGEGSLDELRARAGCVRAGWRGYFLPSHDLFALVSKEWRELSASRAFWLLLLMTGPLDGKPLLDDALPEPVSGKVGLWSKTDSVSYFDDFNVTPKRSER
jgi:hypothetical protein